MNYIKKYFLKEAEVKKVISGKKGGKVTQLAGSSTKKQTPSQVAGTAARREIAADVTSPWEDKAYTQKQDAIERVVPPLQRKFARESTEISYRRGLRALFEAALMEKEQVGLSPEEDESLAGPKGTPASEVAKAGAHLETMDDKDVEAMTPREKGTAQKAVNLRVAATKKAGGGKLDSDGIKDLFAKIGNTGGDRRQRGVSRNRP